MRLYSMALNFVLILFGAVMIALCVVAAPLMVLYMMFGVLAFLCGVLGIDNDRRTQSRIKRLREKLEGKQ